MSDALPVIYLARHGETAWNLTGQHMGVVDLPLTERGGAQRAPARGTAAGADLRQGLHQPAAAGLPDV
jgi:broad specificity phosphatase PhoE